MKALKVSIGIVVALLIILVGLGLTAPKEATVKRSISIKASNENVWQHVASLEEQHNWSPWAPRDPNMKFDFEGETGAIGSVYNWSGNEDVGSGYQKITAINPPNRIEQDLVFTAPWESEADVWIEIGDNEGEQVVTWGFKTEFDFVTSIFMLMNDMDASLGPDFEEGLANLKALCESKAEPSPENTNQTYEVDGITIIEKQFGPRSFVGIRKVVKFEDLPTFRQTNFAAVMKEINDAGYETDGAPTCLYWNWDEEKKEADVAAVVPIKGSEVSVVNFETFTVNPSLVCEVIQMGAYENLGTAHEAIEKHMNNRGFFSSQNIAIEEYANDPTTVDPAEIKTIVTYPVSLK